MNIVPVSEIPKANGTPTDNLIEIYKTCLKMEATCLKHDGAGLSAVQVGIPWDLFIVRYESPLRFRYFLNCNYSEKKVDFASASKFESIEGCLSLVDADNKIRRFAVERYPTVQVVGQELVISPDLKLVAIDLILNDDYETIVFQHEIDHGLGVLISDIGVEMELKKYAK